MLAIASLAVTVPAVPAGAGEPGGGLTSMPGIMIETPAPPPVPGVAWEPIAEEGGRLSAATEVLPVAGGEVVLCLTGVPADVRSVMVAAAQRWADNLAITEGLVVEVGWVPLGDGVLGGAGPTWFFNDPVFPHDDTWYPVGLANQLVGYDTVPGTGCQEDTSDVVMELNSAFGGWYKGTDGLVPAGYVDLLTVALHEIGHGLGYASSARAGTDGTLRRGYSDGGAALPFVYDLYVERDGDGRDLFDFADGSAELASFLQSGDVVFAGSSATATNGGQRLPLHAPQPWEQGSSISHFDPDVYPQSSPHALMAPALSPGTSFRPTDLTRAVLADLGWTTTVPGSTPPPPPPPPPAACPSVGELTDQVCRVYLASFLRAADASGLAYWRSVRAAGTPLAAIATEFAASPEFASRYGPLSDGQFVTLVYQNVLGRQPDSAGLAYWTNQLEDGLSRGHVVVGFSESAEHIASTGTVAASGPGVSPMVRLYRAYFLRDPDAAGLDHWVGQLQGGGSLESVSASFATSPEFASRYGSLDDLQFVTLVYTNVLGRSPDDAGLAHWTGMLGAGGSRGAMMIGFSESAEYRMRTDTLP